ncbi:MAG: helix-turn-helix transcriptional regulator, partial [Clostridia bacterium]|nr:helix-turn-helix transcriptional regulator [Clostridia bacterium]
INEILSRIGYVRNYAHISARELSLRLGMCEQYMGRVESGKIVLQMSKLLEILDICEFPVERFFSPNIREYDVDTQVYQTIIALSPDKKKHLLDFLTTE